MIQVRSITLKKTFLNARVGDFMFSKSLLALLIDQLIETYVMIIIMQMTQNFTAQQGENRLKG